MKYLALDVGQKRVGLATGSDESGVAVPLAVFERDEKFWGRLESLWREKGFERLVVGWPVGLNGQESRQTEAVRDFITELSQRLPDAIVERVDERLTSKATGLKTENDAQAAALILNNYLERKQ